ncbi:thiamine phosphate synthase [Thermogutta sp.]|uniref:thiamine phosphate synthase n=1 Tax=Thermogutta sp. TaxID=1962930 RepID=UPI003C7B21C2
MSAESLAGKFLLIPMEREFTPGALRALAAAATWQFGEGFGGLRLVSILMGLLAEPECRAAMILRELGISEELLLARWPELHRTPEPPPIPLESPPQFHPEVKSLFTAVDLYMDWGDWPPIISTEHLLLGLAGCDHPVADWLREQGLNFTQLRQQILQRYGTGGQWRPASEEPVVAQTESLPLPEEVGSRSAPETNQAQTVACHFSETLEEARLQPKETSADSRNASSGERESAGGLSQLTPSTAMGLYRIVDAAINRALEGLRVVEDYVRFVLDDPFLMGEVKDTRHAFSRLAGEFPMTYRLAARETQFDVGTRIKHSHEMKRESVEGLIDANLSRVREAIRSVEECAKVLQPELAERFEQLRYRCYTLHRAIRITELSRKRLQNARLYVLVDARPSPNEFQALITSLVQAGVDMIQLREKKLEDRLLLERARIARKITRGTQTLFIMNDRPDLAVLSHADGVHVGQEELTVKDVRALVGPEMLIGVSTHNIEQARQAVLDGANYIGCGPTFPSSTKQFSHFPGLDFLREVASEITLPAFAIGGINESNIEEVLNTGISRVAVSAAVVDAPDPPAAAKRLLAKLQDKPLR